MQPLGRSRDSRHLSTGQGWVSNINRSEAGMLTYPGTVLWAKLSKRGSTPQHPSSILSSGNGETCEIPSGSITLRSRPRSHAWSHGRWPCHKRQFHRPSEPPIPMSASVHSYIARIRLGLTIAESQLDNDWARQNASGTRPR